ncbi:MAG: hypothetical protein ACR2PR_07445, partial [Pseudohongiellaceae bacterium]
ARTKGTRPSRRHRSDPPLLHHTAIAPTPLLISTVSPERRKLVPPAAIAPIRHYCTAPPK